MGRRSCWLAGRRHGRGISAGAGARRRRSSGRGFDEVQRRPPWRQAGQRGQRERVRAQHAGRRLGVLGQPDLRGRAIGVAQAAPPIGHDLRGVRGPSRRQQLALLLAVAASGGLRLWRQAALPARPPQRPRREGRGSGLWPVVQSSTRDNLSA